MQGYFEKLIENYGAQEAVPPVEMPWMHEVEAPEAPVAAAPHVADPPAIETKTPGSPTEIEEAPSAIIPASLDPPTDFDQNSFELDPIEASTPERIERLTERVIERIPTEVSQAKEPEITDGPDGQTAQSEPAPVGVTHQHEHIHVYEAPPPAPEPGAEDGVPPVPPEAPDSPDPAPAPQSPDRDALVDLETHLVKALSQIHGAETAESVPRIEPADFELTDEGPPLPLESETVREVTREVVKEVHHHHHETRIEPVPPRTPRSAEEASQIGQIRFASPWDLQGGM